MWYESVPWEVMPEVLNCFVQEMRWRLISLTEQLKIHIQRNTDLQREAAKEVNKIKKPTVKLRNNVIFGKSIENLRKKVEVENVTIRKRYLMFHLDQSLKEENNFVMEQ